MRQKFDTKSQAGFTEGDVNFSPQRKDWAKMSVETNFERHASKSYH